MLKISEVMACCAEGCGKYLHMINKFCFCGNIYCADDSCYCATCGTNLIQQKTICEVEGCGNEVSFVYYNTNDKYVLWVCADRHNIDMKNIKYSCLNIDKIWYVSECAQDHCLLSICETMADISNTAFPYLRLSQKFKQEYDKCQQVIIHIQMLLIRRQLGNIKNGIKKIFITLQDSDIYYHKYLHIVENMLIYSLYKSRKCKFMIMEYVVGNTDDQNILRIKPEFLRYHKQMIIDILLIQEMQNIGKIHEIAHLIQLSLSTYIYLLALVNDVECPMPPKVDIRYQAAWFEYKQVNK
jgi:hypothetical protein